MSMEGLLKRVSMGPRSKKNVRAGKIIRMDEHGMERFSDFFTDQSASESECDASRKENIRRSEMQDIHGVTIPSMASFSPLSTSNKTNVSTNVLGMTLRNKKSLGANSIQTNMGDNQNQLQCSALSNLKSVTPKEIPVSNQAKTSYDHENGKVQQLSSNTLDAQKQSLILDQETKHQNEFSGDRISIDYKGLTNDVESKENEDTSADSDDGGAVETTAHSMPPDVVQSSVKGRSSCIQDKSSEHSGNSLKRGASVSTKNVSKRKKKRKSDMFTTQKKRKKSFGNSKQSEQLQISGLSPIFPTQNVKKVTSTPAVNKFPGRFPDSTISEGVPSLAALEGRPYNLLGTISCDPLTITQGSVLKKNLLQKNVTFNHTSNKDDANEKIIEALATENITAASPTVLPSYTTAEPIHYFETTVGNHSIRERKIIYPDQEDGNLRRSKRTRVVPLKWYKNERIKYKRTENGWAVEDIILPPNSPKGTHCLAKRLARKVKKNKNCGELSVHVPVDENVLKLESNSIEVCDGDTNNLITLPCIFKHNQYNKTSCDTKELATDEDPVVMTKPLQTRHFGFGHLEIRPKKEKRMQRLKNDSLLFIVLHGKVEVTIHESSFVVQTKDAFRVPPGNVYGIKNLRRDEAHLAFINFKNYKVDREGL